MVARGERPMYRIEWVSPTPDGRVRIVELPWLEVPVGAARDARTAVRAAIAEWLGVGAEAFDLEGG